MGEGVRSAAAYVRGRMPVARRDRAAAAAGRDAACRCAPIACNLVVGLAPVGFVIATSVVIGRLPGAVRGGWDSPDGRALVWAIAAAGVFLAIQQGVSPVLGVLGERISRRVDGIVRDRLAAASVGSPTIAALEDQELLGHLERGRRAPGVQPVHAGPRRLRARRADQPLRAGRRRRRS